MTEWIGHGACLFPVGRGSLFSTPMMISKTFGGDMPLFLIYCFFGTWYNDTDMRRYITLWLHGWRGLEAAGSWIVVGLQMVCSVRTWDFQDNVSRGITQCPPSGLEPMFRTSEALTTQYLNVCQRKLGTIIIQTVQCPYPTALYCGHRLTAQGGHFFAWESQSTSK